jgi:hypothetical protein
LYFYYVAFQSRLSKATKPEKEEMVIGSYKDSIVTASSNNLFVLINYDNCRNRLIQPATLRTATDSLNSILIKHPKTSTTESENEHPLCEYIRTSRSELNFQAELQMNKIVRTIYANGELKQIAGILFLCLALISNCD